MGINQHHDAAPGTAKQYVSDDYASRISKAFGETDAAFKAALRIYAFPERWNEVGMLHVCSVTN